MSAYPSGQRCPRCQYPVPPGATSCANCGLVFASPLSATPGANPAYPPQQQGSGSYSTPPASEGFGPPQASPGSYSSSSQQPTVYSPQSTLDSAPTVASALYPQDPGGPGSYPSAYPGSQPPVGYPGSAPAYPGSQPQGGYPGSAPAYLGSQPQGGYPGPAPAYLGSQPQGSFGAPPIAPPPQPVQQKSGNGLKIALIALVILVILGAGGGVAAYILTRPKPVITVTSDYKVRSTYAGAAGTVFHIMGQKFSGDSTITILLDGNQAPGTKTIQSDSDGNIKADVVVTPDWPTGNNHTLSARDASGYAPQTAATVAIVNQGEAGTPGPNGSPVSLILLAALSVILSMMTASPIRQPARPAMAWPTKRPIFSNVVAPIKVASSRIPRQLPPSGLNMPMASPATPTHPSSTKNSKAPSPVAPRSTAPTALMPSTSSARIPEAGSSAPSQATPKKAPGPARQR